VPRIGALTRTAMTVGIDTCRIGQQGPKLGRRGGIAYPGGLGPGGPDQKSNGCSPLNRPDPGTDTSERLLVRRCFGAGQSLLAALLSLFGS
jgi:hypothetical protein